MVDDEDRENEGDLIFSTENLNTQQMALLIRECSGIVCLCITSEKAAALRLPPMVGKNTSPYGTAFTVSIEAAEGVTTGVSASDRVQTVRTAVAVNAQLHDLRHPEHVFPLVAHIGPANLELPLESVRCAAPVRDDFGNRTLMFASAWWCVGSDGT